MRLIGHWVGGKPLEGASGRSGPVYNPATGEQQASVAFASSDEVGQAVRTAAAAWEARGESSLSQRSEILFAFKELLSSHAGELAGMVVDEHGKV